MVGGGMQNYVPIRGLCTQKGQVTKMIKQNEMMNDFLKKYYSPFCFFSKSNLKESSTLYFRWSKTQSEIECLYKLYIKYIGCKNVLLKKSSLNWIKHSRWELIPLGLCMVTSDPIYMILSNSWNLNCEKIQKISLN